MWATRRGVPYVLTLYGTEIWHYRRRWPIDPFTRAYRGARRVTFYSRKLLERAQELGLDREGLAVVYPTVGAAFQPLDADARARVRRDLGITEHRLVLNVKRLHELAGQRVPHRRVRARLARPLRRATGPLRRRAAPRRRSKTRRAAPASTARSRSPGLVDNRPVARYAAAADVFVLPSLLEALPTVAVEALGAGTPVLSADHPGGLELHELFGDDVRIVPEGRCRCPRRGAWRRAGASGARSVRRRWNSSSGTSGRRAVEERVRRGLRGRTLAGPPRFG